MTTKRKVLWAVCALFFMCLVSGLIFRAYQQNKIKAQQEAEQKAQENTPPPASENIRLIYQAARIPLLPKKDDHLSTACADYIFSIRGVDLRLVRIFPPKSPPFPGSDTCKDLPKNLVEYSENYKEACAILMKPMVELTQKIWGDSLPPCMVALFHFRAQLTQLLTRNISLNDIDDPKVLLDKMMATMTGVDYRLNGKIAEMLLGIEPTLVPAAEMLVLSRFKQAQAEAKGKPEDKKWEDLDHALHKLIEIGMMNPKQVLEWQMLITLFKNPDPEDCQLYMEKILAQYPDWILPLYYKAWAMYNVEEVTGARTLLESIKKKDLVDPRFKETLEKIYKKDPHPFRADFVVSFPREVFN